MGNLKKSELTSKSMSLLNMIDQRTQFILYVGSMVVAHKDNVGGFIVNGENMFIYALLSW